MGYLRNEQAKKQQTNFQMNQACVWTLCRPFPIFSFLLGEGGAAFVPSERRSVKSNESKPRPGQSRFSDVGPRQHPSGVTVLLSSGAVSVFHIKFLLEGLSYIWFFLFVGEGGGGIDKNDAGWTQLSLHVKNKKYRLFEFLYFILFFKKKKKVNHFNSFILLRMGEKKNKHFLLARSYFWSGCREKRRGSRCLPEYPSTCNHFGMNVK